MPAESPRAAAVVLAAGAGRRVGAEVNKVLLELNGESLLVHSVRTALAVSGVRRLVVVVRAGEEESIATDLTPHLGHQEAWVVVGGETRADSEWAALAALRREIDGGELDVVAVHDAARPLASAAMWQQVIGTAAAEGAAIPVVPGPPLSRRGGGQVPARLVGVQTPQAFRAEPLLRAYARAREDLFSPTDTAGCWERYVGSPIAGVPSTSGNLKVTFPEDVAVAAALLSRTPPS